MSKLEKDVKMSLLTTRETTQSRSRTRSQTQKTQQGTSIISFANRMIAPGLFCDEDFDIENSYYKVIKELDLESSENIKVSFTYLNFSDISGADTKYNGETNIPFCCVKSMTISIGRFSETMNGINYLIESYERGTILSKDLEDNKKIIALIQCIYYTLNQSTLIQPVLKKGGVPKRKQCKDKLEGKSSIPIVLYNIMKVINRKPVKCVGLFGVLGDIRFKRQVQPADADSSLQKEPIILTFTRIIKTIKNMCDLREMEIQKKIERQKGVVKKVETTEKKVKEAIKSIKIKEEKLIYESVKTLPPILIEPISEKSKAEAKQIEELRSQPNTTPTDKLKILEYDKVKENAFFTIITSLDDDKVTLSSSSVANEFSTIIQSIDSEIQSIDSEIQSIDNEAKNELVENLQDTIKDTFLLPVSQVESTSKSLVRAHTKSKPFDLKPILNEVDAISEQQNKEYSELVYPISDDYYYYQFYELRDNLKTALLLLNETNDNINKLIIYLQNVTFNEFKDKQSEIHALLQKIQDAIDNGPKHLLIDQDGNVDLDMTAKNIFVTLNDYISKNPFTGGSSSSSPEKITILGRKRNIIIKNRAKYVNIKGELVLLSLAKKMEKQLEKEKCAASKKKSKK
jgi:hypothetical protein